MAPSTCVFISLLINKVDRKINKIRCRKHSLHIAFSSCVCSDKACGTLIDLRHLRVIDRTTELRRGFKAMLSGVDARALSGPFFSASIWSTVRFATMSNSTLSWWPWHTVIFQALRSFGLRKLQSSGRTPAPLNVPTSSVLKTARRKENYEAV